MFLSFQVLNSDIKLSCHTFLFKYFHYFVVLMITQETLGQVKTLRKQKLTYDLSFAKAFDSIVKELKLHEMAVYRKECQELLYRVHSRIKIYTKFSKVWLLAPIVVYAVFRSKGATIKAHDFCRASNISLSDFKKGLLIVNPVYFEYIKRDCKESVSQLIAKMIAKFNLDSTFREVTKKTFKSFFPLFKNTKDNIVAGLIITLSFVALDYELPALSEIFEALGTDITRAHYNLRTKIFLPNHLGNFKGFAKSKEQLKQFLLTKI